MLKNVHAIIFRVKIFSYASRPYENILTTKIFNNENLEHKVAQRILAENGSILGHHSMLERCCNATGIPTTRRIDTKERSRRRSSDFYPREK